MKVIAAMSGGVDSSVVAAMLVEQGHEVIGVTLNVEPRQLSLEQPVERVDACCSLSAVEDARRVADLLGIPHYTLNFRDVFRERVIDDFVAEYRRGRTPNPCVRCNEHIKFEGVLNRLHALDADAVATGHFARREWDADRGRWALLRGVDDRKDQSYVLYPLTQQLLARSLFPIGHLTKPEVRERARQLGLATAEKPESQEICFVVDNDYGRFIEQYAPDAGRPGPIVDMDGRSLGEHRGIVHYTIGQRRGLGLASGQPLFVIEIDAERNAIVVGPESELLRVGMEVEDINWVSTAPPDEPFQAGVKIRYRAPEMPVRVEPIGADRARVLFETPLKAVTPGQAAVLYDGGRVLAGGTIARALRAADSPSPARRAASSATG